MNIACSIGRYNASEGIDHVTMHAATWIHSKHLTTWAWRPTLTPDVILIGHSLREVAQDEDVFVFEVDKVGLVRNDHRF